MKYKFEIEYDSENGVFTLLNNSDNVVCEHSGSSYFRIKPNDKSFYGNIFGSHFDHCYDQNHNLICESNHFHITIKDIKDDS